MAQTGISVSPPRTYFDADSGESSIQKIVVSNVSTQNTLDLAVSLGDWRYNEKGENIMFPPDTLANSCASWVAIKKEDTYFTLHPGERKTVEVRMTVPKTASDTAHTAMLYVTQMNAVDDTDLSGAHIRVNVRSGIKLFQKTRASSSKKIEVTNMLFSKEQKALAVHFENQGAIWADGILYTDLVNTQTGIKTKIEQINFFSMPGDKRIIDIPLPKDLSSGEYMASVVFNYGNRDQLEMAELKFTYE